MKNKKQKIFKLLTCLVIIFAILVGNFNALNVQAGLGISTGSGESSSSDSSGDYSDDFNYGNGNYYGKLRWVVKAVPKRGYTVNWGKNDNREITGRNNPKCLGDMGSQTYSKSSTKYVALLQKIVSTGETFYVRWSWILGVSIFSGGNTAEEKLSGTIANGYAWENGDDANPGIFPGSENRYSAEAIEAINKELKSATYHSNYGAYSYNGKYVDVVTAPAKARTTKNEKWVITKLQYIYKNPSTGKEEKTVVDYDYTNNKKYRAKWLYNNAPEDDVYEGKTEQGQTKYLCCVKATLRKVIKTTTTNGSTSSTKYSYSTTKTLSKQIRYEVKAPSVAQKYFKPYDLNTMDIAKESIVKKAYKNYREKATNGTMDITVDNYQDIKDGKSLKALDTNSSIKFKIILNNNFGLPNTIKMLDSQPSDGVNTSYNNKAYPGVFKNKIVERAGSTATGVLKYTKGNVVKSKGNKVLSKNINGIYSKDYYWNASLIMSINSNYASISINNDEVIGKSNDGKSDSSSCLTKTSNSKFRGGEFKFKTTKTGDYYLSNGVNKNWWEITYNQGIYYAYGIKYQGEINADPASITNPSVIRSGLYAGLSTKTMRQPVVRGKINAKTVGGDLDN